MASLKGFDANQVNPNAGFDVLPAGEYLVAIVESDILDTKAGNGQYLKIEMIVLEGEHKNQHLWHNFNIVNPSEKAVEIGKGQLSALCRAVNVLTPNDSSELHNLPFLVKVKIRKSEQYGDQNDVTTFKAASEQKAEVPGVTPASASSEAPW